MRILSDFKHICKGFCYSKDGFVSALNSEVAFRQEVFFLTPLILVAFFLPVSTIELILMIFSIILIFLMELTNTAIEAIINRISLDYHSLSKKAKDIGSLLVLISFMNFFMTWGIIIYSLLKS